MCPLVGFAGWANLPKSRASITPKPPSWFRGSRLITCTSRDGESDQGDLTQVSRKAGAGATYKKSGADDDDRALAWHTCPSRHIDVPTSRSGMFEKVLELLAFGPVRRSIQWGKVHFLSVRGKPEPMASCGPAGYNMSQICFLGSTNSNPVGSLR